MSLLQASKTLARDPSSMPFQSWGHPTSQSSIPRINTVYWHRSWRQEQVVAVLLYPIPSGGHGRLFETRKVAPLVPRLGNIERSGPAPGKSRAA
jgi:hypothetical protein